MKKKVIGFVHTHWDREWYREFEVFRMRLLRVFDNILQMLESNTLPSFYFDGQTSALDDYLKMRPEKIELVKSLIKSKRLFIGPFYCLIDEFLTDATVLRKNLEIGLDYSKKMGCFEYLGYFADTFGHTSNVIPILNEFGIDTAIVWRGCPDIPAEFTWQDDFGNKINCINLVRGYFNDFFTADIELEKRVELIKDNLDKIARLSGDVLLMPIGGDHLGVNPNLLKIIEDVNQHLDGYEIVIGSIFDYIKEVQERFNQYTHIGELRDNSKTFTLQGSFSSRLDLKRLNIETSHLLEFANRYRKTFVMGDKYENLIQYAYGLLLQNQAHDSIYGCSLDDVHRENIVRYKKIQQIANTIIDELRFENNISDFIVKNVGDINYSGSIEFCTTNKNEEYQLLDSGMGFDKKLLNDTLKVPVTEDYTEIYKYIGIVNNLNPNESTKILPVIEPTDVFVSDKCIGNSKIFLSVEGDLIKIGNYELRFIDYIDCGDSYNEGPLEKDIPKIGKIIESKVLYSGQVRSALSIKVDIVDVLDVIVELDTQSEVLSFKIAWNNTYTNHKLQVVINTLVDIKTTYSEDMSKIIKRDFNAEYDIRHNLPKSKGLEAKNNTAPFQRGIWANGVGVITKGLTQYEVFGKDLGICMLRSTDILSNPKNPARTTPAGPPIKLNDLQQLGKNIVEFNLFIGDKDSLKSIIDKVFSFVG